MTDRLTYLFTAYMHKTAKSTERQELWNIVKQPGQEDELKRLIGEAMEHPGEEYTISPEKADEIFDRLLHINHKAAHRIHFLKTAWFRYAAAIILLLGIGGYLLWRESSEIPAFREKDKGNVVQSGVSSNNKAILTLADGSQIILDDKVSGNIAQQGNTQIIKLDGNQLAYNGNPKKPSPPAMEGTVFDPREAGQKPGVGALYNTITTPRGSQYQVILPDGTKTWLNAASSIKFPTTFTGNQRKVETTGEIYFEVKMNKTQPFFVISKGLKIQVLGTSFNVNMHKEESGGKTSLLDGAVKVNDQLLAPGQAWLNGKVMNTDLEQDMAWKKGLFNFNELSLKEAMNELARWYDVDIVYEGQLPQFGFSGEIGRDLSLHQLLNILSGLGGVNFRMEGQRKLVVSAQ